MAFVGNEWMNATNSVTWRSTGISWSEKQVWTDAWIKCLHVEMQPRMWKRNEHENCWIENEYAPEFIDFIVLPKATIRLRSIHIVHYSSLVDMISPVIVLILNVVKVILKADTGSIWCLLIIVFTMPSQKEAGMCRFILLDSSLVVHRMYRALKEHVCYSCQGPLGLVGGESTIKTLELELGQKHEVPQDTCSWLVNRYVTVLSFHNYHSVSSRDFELTQYYVRPFIQCAFSFSGLSAQVHINYVIFITYLVSSREIPW